MQGRRGNSGPLARGLGLRFPPVRPREPAQPTAGLDPLWCPQCGYDLRGRTADHCVECGHACSKSDVWLIAIETAALRDGASRRVFWLSLLALLLCVIELIVPRAGFLTIIFVAALAVPVVCFGIFVAWWLVAILRDEQPVRREPACTHWGVVREFLRVRFGMLRVLAATFGTVFAALLAAIRPGLCAGVGAFLVLWAVALLTTFEATYPYAERNLPAAVQGYATRAFHCCTAVLVLATLLIGVCFSVA